MKELHLLHSNNYFRDEQDLKINQQYLYQKYVGNAKPRVLFCQQPADVPPSNTYTGLASSVARTSDGTNTHYTAMDLFLHNKR